MTSNDKKTLYTLLKTASDNISGYASPGFPASMPLFSDDIAKPQQKTAHTGQTVMPAAAPEHTTPPADRHSGATIETIAQKVLQCKLCGLCQMRRHAVPGEGVTHPVVLVIGEGPGADEDATGRPFVGPAGQLLDKMLSSISLDRHKNCFIANIVKCRPPHNRDPEPQEADSCRSFLEAQIAVLQPAMILAAGRIAAQNLLKTETGIGRLRNNFYTVQNIPTLCTYHPSALLRNADLKRPTWEDLKLFRSRLESIVPDYAAYNGTFFTPSQQSFSVQ